MKDRRTETTSQTDLSPDPERVAEAKRLIGKKAALTGGGMSVQYVYVVKVKDVTPDGHAVVDVLGWGWPDNDLVKFTPLLKYWRVEELAPWARKLPLGRYDLLAGQRDRPREPVVLMSAYAPAGRGKVWGKGHKTAYRSRPKTKHVRAKRPGAPTTIGTTTKRR